MHICTHVYIYIHTQRHTQRHTHTYIYIYTHTYTLYTKTAGKFGREGAWHLWRIWKAIMENNDSHTFWSQDLFTSLKITEEHKEIWFVWVIAINIYHVRNEN